MSAKGGEKSAGGNHVEWFELLTPAEQIPGFSKFDRSFARGINHYYEFQLDKELGASGWVLRGLEARNSENKRQESTSHRIVDSVSMQHFRIGPSPGSTLLKSLGFQVISVKYEAGNEKLVRLVARYQPPKSNTLFEGLLASGSRITLVRSRVSLQAIGWKRDTVLLLWEV